jgi:hypothetical protein
MCVKKGKIQNVAYLGHRSSGEAKGASRDICPLTFHIKIFYWYNFIVYNVYLYYEAMQQTQVVGAYRADDLERQKECKSQFNSVLHYYKYEKHCAKAPNARPYIYGVLPGSGRTPCEAARGQWLR